MRLEGQQAVDCDSADVTVTEPFGERVIGYIAAPTGAGKAAAEGRWVRGGKPHWYRSRWQAIQRCKTIERDGWRDGGQGRDCYIVAVLHASDGVKIAAGNEEAGGTGISIGNNTGQIGCSLYVSDAIAWLNSRPQRWLRSHGIQ